MSRNQVVEIIHYVVNVATGGTQGVVPYKGQIVGISFPAAVTSTTMTFENSVDFKSNATGDSAPSPSYQSITTTAGSPYSITIAANKHVIIPVSDSAGWGQVRFTFGSTETRTGGTNVTFSIRPTF